MNAIITAYAMALNGKMLNFWNIFLSVPHSTLVVVFTYFVNTNVIFHVAFDTAK